MINKIDLKELESIYNASKSKNDALFIKLMANAECFYEHKLCEIFKITSKKALLGVFVRCNGSIIIVNFKNSGYTELYSYLSLEAKGFNIECSKKAALKINGVLNRSIVLGEILSVKDINKKESEFKVCKTEDIKEFYDTIKFCDPLFKKCEFDAYYCDIFYRKKLPYKMRLIKDNDKNIATAGMFHKYNGISVISDVTVSGEYRKRGLGSLIVSSICREILDEGNTPFVFCVNPVALKMYKKLKFKKKGSFAVIF